MVSPSPAPSAPSNPSVRKLSRKGVVVAAKRRPFHRDRKKKREDDSGNPQQTDAVAAVVLSPVLPQMLDLTGMLAVASLEAPGIWTQSKPWVVAPLTPQQMVSWGPTNRQ